MKNWIYIFQEAICKEWPKNPGSLRPFLVPRFLNWIVCQMTSYDEPSMTRKFYVKLAISSKDMIYDKKNVKTLYESFKWINMGLCEFDQNIRYESAGNIRFSESEFTTVFSHLKDPRVSFRPIIIRNCKIYWILSTLRKNSNKNYRASPVFL